MKSKKLEDMSLPELRKKEKELKVALYAGIVVLAAAVSIYWYLAAKKGVHLLTFLPLVMIPVLALSFAGIKAVRKEMNSRNS